jgi:hypothetical protein
MINVSDKVVEEIKTQIFAHFFIKNRAVCGKMWENMVQPDGPEMTIQYGEWAVLTGEIMHECRHTLKTFSTCGYSTAAMVK